jgi:hypothetical protein
MSYLLVCVSPETEKKLQLLAGVWCKGDIGQGTLEIQAITCLATGVEETLRFEKARSRMITFKRLLIAEFARNPQPAIANPQ